MNSNYIKRLWVGFWQLADPKIWVASTIPMAVGGTLAYNQTGKFEFYWFFVSLIAMYLIEIGKNAVNEVVDYVSGVDRVIELDKRTPFSGGKKTIVQGKLTIFEAGAIAFFTIGAACIIGLYIMLFRELNIFWIGFIGVALSVFYSLPPFKLAYRGFGEVTVGITFGPLIVSGIFLVMTHTLSVPVVITSLPIGFLIANVLWINQFPDYEADMYGNKRNWVVRLGKRKALKVYMLLFIAAYISSAFLVVIYRNPFWLMTLLGGPLAIQAINRARKYYDDIPKLVQANGKTVLAYQVMGLTMIIAALLN